RAPDVGSAREPPGAGRRGAPRAAGREPLAGAPPTGTESMTFLDLPAVTRAAGALTLPGSKSISNRTLLLSALARGTTELRSLLVSDDTDVMRAALSALGVRIDNA